MITNTRSRRMCCGVSEDMYDLVIVVTDEGDLTEAFATAFEAREQQQRVSLVLPRTEPFRARTARLRHALHRSDIGLLEGHAEPDVEGDVNYLTVDGRLLRADRLRFPAAI